MADGHDVDTPPNQLDGKQRNLWAKRLALTREHATDEGGSLLVELNAELERRLI